VIIGAWMYYNRVVEPPGFPGEGMTDGWTSNAGTVYPGISLGDYTANGFDNADEYHSVTPNRIDQSDGTPIGGFRYWGHYSDSVQPPMPAIDWPTVPNWVPIGRLGRNVRTVGAVAPVSYKRLTNIIGLDDLIIDDGLTDSVVFTIPIVAPVSLARTGFFPEVHVGKNGKRKRDKSERKLRARNAFMFYILKKIVNVPFEAKEWIDILAEATDFRSWRIRMSAGFKRPGGRSFGAEKFGDFDPERFKKLRKSIRSGFTSDRSVDLSNIPPMLVDGKHENLLKAYYLFELGGLNNLDMDTLRRLIIENELEDAAFGIMGRMSKFVAQTSGAPLGPQFGQLM